jgi:cell division protein FtsI (penicillin-binding protein 3)
LQVVAACFAIGFVSIGARLIDLSSGHESRVDATLVTRGDGPDPRRGDILDRNGELLATNMRVPSIYADPAMLPNIDRAAQQLASVLSGTDLGELTRRLKASRRFAWVKHEVTPKEQQAVLALGIPGVAFQFTEKRIYPRGPLAAHVVGFVDLDNQGLAGIEHSMQEQLVGGAAEGKEPVELSLDMRVQQIVREELLGAYDRFNAKGAAAVVMDRVTGELLSLVSLPDFDPNRASLASSETRKNRVTGNTYELGSLLKLVSTGMALDSGRVDLGDGFDASEPLKIGRHTIRDDHAKKRKLTVPEIFMYSSNIGTAKMVFAAGGGPALQEFLAKVGMLERPQLEVPELARPQLPKRWPDITTATVSFGHGIAITPLQFVDATGALAGDGTRIAPTVLKRDPRHLPPRTRLVNERTAEDLRWLMWLTVEKGTGIQVHTPGYLVGGKTGTADRVDPVNGGYLKHSVIASFCAVFPVEDPRYVVLVMIDDPRGDEGTYGMRYAGWTAGPVVRDIISRAGPLLGVDRSSPVAEARLHERLRVTMALNQRTLEPEERIAALDAPH